MRLVLLSSLHENLLFSAYNAFVTFFSDSIKSLGVVGTLEKYVFDKGANVHGVLMLNRVMSGV